MAYDEGSHKKSRVVIETPTARREVEQTTTARAPERSHSCVCQSEPSSAKIFRPE